MCQIVHGIFQIWDGLTSLSARNYFILMTGDIRIQAAFLCNSNCLPADLDDRRSMTLDKSREALAVTLALPVEVVALRAT
jgi:hypothetical protein